MCLKGIVKVLIQELFWRRDFIESLQTFSGLSVTDCSSAKTFYESATSGVFTIYPIETSSPVRVFCDFEDDGLAWMVCLFVCLFVNLIFYRLVAYRF